MEYQLRHLTDTLKKYDEEQECIDYISTIPVQSQPSSVYFILSDEFYDSIVPIIQQQQQIKPTIYLFSPSFSGLTLEHERWRDRPYQSFFHHSCLISTLSKDLDTEEKISMSINIQDMKNVSIECLDKESQTFLLFQMLTFSFQGRQHDATEIDDFVNVFNLYNEMDISKLAQTYSSEDVLWWYASDTFISRLLDEAFKTTNISLLFKIRFFIISLLNQPFNILSDDVGQILTSYRQECITNEKLIKLKLNINRLLSINQLYLTTLEKPKHILQQSESTNMECVLFQIDVDTSTEIIHPYFIINDYRSKMLFTFGTVFQIQSVELDTNTHVWNVKLVLNEEVKNQVVDLIDQLVDEFGSPFDFMTMGDLIDTLKEYNKAIECYTIFINETPEDDEDIPMAYKHLGLSYYHNASYTEALENYYKALSIYRLRSISPYDHLFVNIYKHIGQAYDARHQYAIAIDYYKEAIRIQKTHLSSTNTLHSLYYSIADSYSKIGDQKKYHEYFDKIILVQHEDSFMILADDPSFKRTINYMTALENLQKVLIDLINNKSSKTQQFDYDIATLYYKVGEIYFEMKSYEQALDQFKKVVDIYLNAFPLILSNLVRNHNAITDTSIRILQNYLVEHEYHFRFKPLRYSLLAETYHYIAKIYFLEPEYFETAVSIYKLADAIKSAQQDY